MKYYHEHQRTCSNILIKFTYLMALKLLYILRDWETNKEGITTCSSAISRPLKTTKCIYPVPFSRKLFRNFLQIVIKVSLAEFIVSKIPWFKHIPLNALRRMFLDYENCSLRRILFYNLVPRAILKNSLSPSSYSWGEIGYLRH